MIAAEAQGDTKPDSSGSRGFPIAIGLAAIVLAHLPLLTYNPGSGSLEGIENALFETTSASPGLVMICWLWFIYMRWPHLRGFEGQESPLAGSLLLFVGAGLCVWAHYVATPTLLVFSFSLLSLASGLLLGGMAAFRTLLFPAAFLLLAVPVPTPIVNSIMYSLQLANAAAAGFVLSLFRFAPVVSGDLIYVGDQAFQVIESCSGLRTILVVVMSACVYSQLVWHDRGRTIVLIALSPFVGILTNHLRILTIILNPYSSIASVHAAQGLVMVVFAVLIIAMLDSFLARVWKTPIQPHLQAEAPTGRLPLNVSGSFAVICTSLAVASLSVAPWSLPEEKIVPLVRIKADLPNWNLKGYEPDREFLGSVRFDEFIAHRYQRGDEPPVDLFVASNRRVDPLLGLGSTKTLVPGRGAVSLSIEFDLGAPSPNVDAAVIRMPTQHQLVYHWKIGMASVWEETARAVLALDRSPFRRLGRSAFVRLSTPIESDPRGLADAIARLRILMDALRGDFVKLGIEPRAGR